MSRDTDVDPALAAKIIDLPPFGARNPDPLTDEAGSHPIEVGVGAAVTGAAGGVAAGAAVGPVGVVLGAIGGALLGGAFGKDFGEVIDVTIDVPNSPPRGNHIDHETERRAFRFGADARLTCPDRPFTEVELELQPKWKAAGEAASWGEVREIVRLAFDRGAPPAA
ncbi:MAG TPA: hypothetical protein VMZ71_09050 [Gemmataceae bacterium]|nr:hypothetical protein [Gemmataceae bacterium]